MDTDHECIPIFLGIIIILLALLIIVLEPYGIKHQRGEIKVHSEIEATSTNTEQEINLNKDAYTEKVAGVTEVENIGEVKEDSVDNINNTTNIRHWLVIVILILLPIFVVALLVCALFL